jgi:hypothetical protein
VIATYDAPAAPPALGAIDLLLRDREAVLARIGRGVELPALIRTMLATIAIAMAVVGAALGSYHGGIQIAYAAIKMPLVLLGTAVVSAPALTAIGGALGRRSRLASDLALVITALAFGALLLAATTPLLLLARALEVSYHRMILLSVAVFAVAGIAALQLICRGIAREGAPGWRTAIAGLCLVFSLVGGQLAWALRPYLVRPRAESVVFVHELEGSLLDAIRGSYDSSRGVYYRDEAPLPHGGEPGEAQP